jgi:hypothetical protein
MKVKKEEKQRKKIKLMKETSKEHKKMLSLRKK